MSESADIEALALADFSASAGARVVTCRIEGDRAEVELSVGPDYEYFMYYARDEDGEWIESGSSSGTNEIWFDDPDSSESDAR